MKRFGLWIPPEIVSLEGLSWQEKSFLALISNLSNTDGCFATNRYIGQFFGIGINRVSRVISSLIEKGYVTSHKTAYTHTEKGKRYLAISNIPHITKQNGVIAQKGEHNKYNNKNNNKNLYIKKTQFMDYTTSGEISDFEKLMLKKRITKGVDVK